MKKLKSNLLLVAFSTVSFLMNSDAMMNDSDLTSQPNSSNVKKYQSLLILEREILNNESVLEQVTRDLEKLLERVGIYEMLKKLDVNEEIEDCELGETYHDRHGNKRRSCSFFTPLRSLMPLISGSINYNAVLIDIISKRKNLHDKVKKEISRVLQIELELIKNKESKKNYLDKINSELNRIIEDDLSVKSMFITLKKNGVFDKGLSVVERIDYTFVTPEHEQGSMQEYMDELTQLIQVREEFLKAVIQ